MTIIFRLQILHVTFTMELVLTLVCALVMMVEEQHAVPTSSQHKLVSGLHMELIPSPSSHFYKQYVPLVYRFTVPRWNKTNTVIHGSQNCITTNYTKFFTTCPALFYLNEMHDRFSDYIDNNQPLLVNLQDMGAKPETALVSFDCEKIGPHFEDIFMDEVAVEEYLGRLTSCSPVGSLEFIKGLSNYVYNISSIYLEMRRNFYSEYWLKIDLLDGRVDAALWANAINVFNSLLFQNYMMEINRWKMALVDCEAGKIPSTLLPPSLLDDTLRDMLDALKLENLIPTVSTDTIGNYYKSMISDCVFTNNTFLVRILIPVIPNQEKFLLVKIAPLPFFYHDTNTNQNFQCQIDPEALPNLAENGNAYVLIDLVKNIAYESDCKPGKLCHIPTAQHPLKVSPCATAAFNWERYIGNVTLRMELLKHCPLKCHQMNNYQRDLWKQVSPREFFWFDGSSGNSLINVTCSTKKGSSLSEMILVRETERLGSWTFELGCDCSLKYRSQVFKPKPCNAYSNNNQGIRHQTSHLSPVQWYSSDSMNKIKEIWNVPKDLFYKVDPDLVRQSIELFNQKEGYGLTSSQSPGFLVRFLTLVSLVLVIMMVALAYRLYTLINNLQGLGLNVKGSLSVTGSTGNTGGGQQVSYRNMSSLIDTDNLLNNEGH